MKRVISISIFLLLNILLFATTTYKIFKSTKYKYSIEYPSNFIKKEAKGKNIDFKVADDKTGNSIVIVVKALLPYEKNTTIYDYIKPPNEYIEQAIQLPNVKIEKKGICQTEDGRKGAYLHYTSKEINYTLFFMNYTFIEKGIVYVVTATCNENQKSAMQPIFFRTLQSFSLQ